MPGVHGLGEKSTSGTNVSDILKKANSVLFDESVPAFSPPLSQKPNTADADQKTTMASNVDINTNHSASSQQVVDSSEIITISRKQTVK